MVVSDFASEYRTLFELLGAPLTPEDAVADEALSQEEKRKNANNSFLAELQ